jgi:L-ectoine synthase
MTVVQEGTELHLHYKEHLEANYCVAGEGEVLDVSTGQTFAIRPGTVYALNRNDRHVLRALRRNLRLVCVFNPPLAGQETHNPDGSYAHRDD